jgi:hypothetical protein
MTITMKCIALVALLFQPVWSWISRAHQNAFHPRWDATAVLFETANDRCCDTTNDQHCRPRLGRRAWVQQWLVAVPSAAAVVLAGAPIRAVAQEKENGRFTREAKDFAYSVTPPPGFQQTQKPVKTHLDEINFISDTVKGYQFGITVDPVRINSLKEVRKGLLLLCGE